jgi:hypothetical protein
MPFESEQQRKLCWVLYSAAVKAGKTPAWDCHEWARENRVLGRTKLPMYKRKSTKNKTKKKPKKRTQKRTASKKTTKKKTQKRKLQKK